jgi:hypothetical protein
MEFPSYAAARKYCTTSLAFMSVDQMGEMTDLEVEYFEDVPPVDAEGIHTSPRVNPKAERRWSTTEQGNPPVEAS